MGMISCSCLHVGAYATVSYMMMNDAWRQDVNHLLHLLWGHCKESPEYDKAAWRRLQALLEQVPRQGPSQRPQGRPGATVWERLTRTSNDEEFSYGTPTVSFGVDIPASLDFVDFPVHVQVPDGRRIGVARDDRNTPMSQLPEQLRQSSLIVHRKPVRGV